MSWAHCDELSATAPRAQGHVYRYGTAGFRAKHTVLDSTLLRMGMLSAVVSSESGGRPAGLMITASHNAWQDNGAKLMDAQGAMLGPEWEALATELANAALLSSVLSRFALGAGVVVLGMDTRGSSPRLGALAVAGAQACGARVVSLGVVTTPVVHWVVREMTRSPARVLTPPQWTAAYLANLADVYLALTKSCTLPALTVDCAHGVGAVLMDRLAGLLPTQQFTLVNTKVTDLPLLNAECGAEHVQKRQLPPAGVPDTPQNTRFASVDGDGDRVVFWYFQGPEFRLLDGDKIMALAAGHLQGLVREAGLSLRLGAVQTAYANGASTQYLTEVLGVPVTCVATGVKHLHHAAEDYDIGLYFEANGHGTVLFSDTALHVLEQEESIHAEQLVLLSRLINQAVGDALSDILLVEAILSARQWSLAQWDALYTDLPSYQSKVEVDDRYLVITSADERRVVEPSGLQDAIDQAVASVTAGRAFVRPSGTEDVVRVYAEASTPQQARALGQLVEQAVVTHVKT